MVGGFGRTIGAWADFFDVESVHEALVVLVGGEVGGGGSGVGGLRGLGGEWE
jgi:hypothetical protein